MRRRITFVVATVAGSALAVVVWLTVRSPADPLSRVVPALDLPPGWAEVAVPEPGTPAHERLGHALGFSRSDWTVTAAGGRAAVEPGAPEFAGSRPPFALDVPEVPELVRTPVAAAEVDGGWVVAYDRGEWGGAVWWFSPDGRERREVSRHQVH